MKPIKWASIESMHNIRKDLHAFRKHKERSGEEFQMDPVDYRAKVKLDGTNGCIQITSKGQVIPQSRTQILGDGVENYGFAAWVESKKAYFQSLGNRPEIFDECEVFSIFGEWCGPGIQGRTAVSQLKNRIFAVYAIQFGDHNDETTTSYIEIEPKRISDILQEQTHSDLFVLPWHGETIEIDYFNIPSLEQAVEKLNQMVAEVEAEDPWVKSMFALSGMGEGIVMYPVGRLENVSPVGRDLTTRLMFKAKGERHRVVKQSKPVQIDPEVAKSVDDFATMFVTESRCQQALEQACGENEPTIKELGHFLKWISNDVQKESTAELEASQLTWKQVSKAVSTKAKQWFSDRLTALSK